MFQNVEKYISKKNQSITINLLENGLAYNKDDKEIERLLWCNVKEVFAFKIDLFAVDQIGIGFRMDDSGTRFFIDEESACYRRLIAKLPKIFEGIRTVWFSEVAFPAFETNLMTRWGEPMIEKILVSEDKDNDKRKNIK